MKTAEKTRKRSEAVERAANHLMNASEAETGINAAMSQARVEELMWAFDIDKQEVWDKQKEMFGRSFDTGEP